MPLYFPDDIWLYVIQMRPTYCGRKYLHNMALTCRQLHQISTPIIYHDLWFEFEFKNDYSGVIDDNQSEYAMVGLIRDLTRAKSLLQSPHLLRHVRQLTLWNWDLDESRETIYARYFSSGHDSDGPVDTSDLGNLILAIYDLISRLVLHMPQLQQLKLVQSPMTPLLYAAMCSRPRLTSFHFLPDNQAELQEQSGLPIDLPLTPHIREIHYENWSTNTHADEYISHILDGCITSLNTLSIMSPHLPLVASHICNRTPPLSLPLPLRKFNVYFLGEINLDVEYYRSALWDTIRAASELRTLVIRAHELLPLADISPPNDMHNYLGKLFQLSAGPITIQKLAEGRQLGAVEINESFRISGQVIAQIISCSTTHLRHLTLKAVYPNTQKELDEFVSSSQVFRSLEYLSIEYQLPDTPATRADFHESWKVIKNLLRELKHLHSFNLNSQYIGRTYGIVVECPLDLNDSPLSRGHPTLERIGVSFLRGTLWEWDREHGWVSKKWSDEAWMDRVYTPWDYVDPY